MAVYFTSDTHFGHKNIIKYCDRPFADVAEMDAALIRNWNNVVGPDDTVYHLGDFAFAGAERIKEILAQLNGKVVLVLGNHDNVTVATRLMSVFERPDEGRFYDVIESADLKSYGYDVYLAHHPMPYTIPDGMKMQLCGHVHELWKIKSSRYSTVLNVGVDQWDYTPVSLDEVLRQLGLQAH